MRTAIAKAFVLLALVCFVACDSGSSSSGPIGGSGDAVDDIGVDTPIDSDDGDIDDDPIPDTDDDAIPDTDGSDDADADADENDVGVDGHSDTDSGDADADSSDDDADINAGDADAGATAGFTVRVVADGNLTSVGSSVTLVAELALGDAAGDLSWSWDLGDATSVSDPGASEQVVGFDAAGRATISVIGEDEDGEVATAGTWIVVVSDGAHFVGDVDGDSDVDAADVDAMDAMIAGEEGLAENAFTRADVWIDGDVDTFDRDLVQSAVDAGDDAPTYLSADEGAPTRMLNLIHPALLDPDADVLIEIDGVATPPFRPAPGYANTIVPLGADVGTTDLRVLVDDTEAWTTPFEVLALPEASDTPGARIVGTVRTLADAAQAISTLLDAYADAVEADDTESAILVGMTGWAADRLTMAADEMNAAFADADPLLVERWEQVMLANGLADLSADLAALQTELDAIEASRMSITVGQAATIIDVICAAQDLIDLADKIAEINSLAADIISYIDWPPLNLAPGVGPVIRALSSVSDLIATITDIIGVVGEYLPELGDGLDLTASPGRLEILDSTSVSVTVELKIAGKLCGNALGAAVEALVEQINEKLTQGIARQVPYFGGAFRRARYNTDNMDWIESSIYEAIGDLAGSIVDALGIQEGLESLAGRLCSYLGEPDLPLDTSILRASCGTISNGVWTCSATCVGTVAFTAEDDLCGETLDGMVFAECVGCNSENCPDGCCDGSEMCQVSTDAHCGVGGEMCEVCVDPEMCVEGECLCESDCAGQDGETRCGAGEAIETCTEVADDCFQWTETGNCADDVGGTCVDGACEGGCQASTCEGCCSGPPDHTCLPFDMQNVSFCGSDGARCLACTGPDIDDCVMGMCVCTDECDPSDPPTCDGDTLQTCTGMSPNGCWRLEDTTCAGGCSGGSCAGTCDVPLTATLTEEAGMPGQVFATLISGGDGGCEVRPGFHVTDPEAVAVFGYNPGGGNYNLGAVAENNWEIGMSTEGNPAGGMYPAGFVDNLPQASGDPPEPVIMMGLGNPVAMETRNIGFFYQGNQVTLVQLDAR